MFVSLGPGDPELITLKGLKILKNVDSIFCPATGLNKGIVSSKAAGILSALEIDKEKLIFFDVPMSKDRTAAIATYEKVAEEIAVLYENGKKIAVVAEGDSGFYSSIHYISDYLIEKGIPYEKTAGVPAFIACGALANIHILKQEERLEVIPGNISYNELCWIVSEGRTLVIMKCSQNQAEIKHLLSYSDDVEFHYFENIGIPEKEYYTTDIKLIKERTFPYFSLLIIRKNK